MASEKKLLSENVRRLLLKEYIMNKTERTGLGGLEIQRTPMGTRITLTAERPGMIIGRKGSAIKELTREVEDDFHFDNPQIEVQECRNPNLNAQIMAQRLASSLEKGWHFRRAGHSTVRRIMQSGAKGCLVILTGKLTGQRHRMEKFKDGHIKFCGEQALVWMEHGFATAKVKLGTIGVKVQIMDPNAKLPDEIEVVDAVPVPAGPTPGVEPKEPGDTDADAEEGAPAGGEVKVEAAEGAADTSAAGKEGGEAAPAEKKEEEAEDKTKRKRRKKAEPKGVGEEEAEKDGGALPQLPTKPGGAEPDGVEKDAGGDVKEAPEEDVKKAAPKKKEVASEEVKKTGDGKEKAKDKGEGTEAGKEGEKGAKKKGEKGEGTEGEADKKAPAKKAPAKKVKKEAGADEIAQGDKKAEGAKTPKPKAPAKDEDGSKVNKEAKEEGAKD